MEFREERELLTNLGIASVRRWPSRMTWYGPDGTPVHNLRTDLYHRLLFMRRGMRPELASLTQVRPAIAHITYLREETVSDDGTAKSRTLLAQVAMVFMRDKRKWTGTPSELLLELNTLAREELDINPTQQREYWPPDAARLSKALSAIATTLMVARVEVSRGFRGKQRIIRLHRRLQGVRRR